MDHLVPQDYLFRLVFESIDGFFTVRSLRDRRDGLIEEEISKGFKFLGGFLQGSFRQFKLPVISSEYNSVIIVKHKCQTSIVQQKVI